MKMIAVMWIRPFFLSTLFAMLVAPAAHGQDARVRISHLEKLAAKAEEVVDVNIDGPMLQLATKFLSSGERDEAGVKELVSGLKGVYVKSFEFEKEGAYSKNDLDPIREQLRSPGWSKIVNVQSKQDNETVEIYTMGDTNKMTGLVILAAEPTELTVVNIVGPINLDKLSKLGGHLGIPRIDIEQGDKTEKK
jgi:Domain of unknown function (DUF4252)